MGKKEHETNPPSEDPEESGLPDEFHDFQPQLLRETLRPVGYFPETISH